MTYRTGFAALLLSLVAASAQAGFISPTFLCTFDDDPLELKHSWAFDYVENELTLHEGGVDNLGTDSVTISGETDEDPVFKLIEDVTNDSGYAWTSYILTLPSTGNTAVDSTFVNDSYTWSDSFSTAGIAPYQITFSGGGGVAPSADVNFKFKINVPTTGTFNFNLTQQPVPEPGTMALLVCGAAGLLVLARRRR